MRPVDGKQEINNLEWPQLGTVEPLNKGHFGTRPLPLSWRLSLSQRFLSVFMHYNMTCIIIMGKMNTYTLLHELECNKMFSTHLIFLL